MEALNNSQIQISKNPEIRNINNRIRKLDTLLNDLNEKLSEANDDLMRDIENIKLEYDEPINRILKQKSTSNDNTYKTLTNERDNKMKQAMRMSNKIIDKMSNIEIEKKVLTDRLNELIGLDMLEEFKKIDPNNITSKHIHSILGLEGIDIINDDTTTSYFRYENNKLVLYRHTIVYNDLDDETTTKTSRIPIERIPSSVLNYFTNLYSNHSDSLIKPRIMCNIVGQDNKNIRGITLQFNSSGQLTNENEVRDNIKKQLTPNNGLKLNDRINTLNQFLIFDPIPIDSKNRKMGSKIFKTFIEKVFNQNSNVDGNIALQAIIQSIVEYRSNNYLQFILESNEKTSNGSILYHLFKLLFGVNYNKMVKIKIDEGEIIHPMTKYDNPYISIFINTISLKYELDIAKELNIYQDSYMSISKKLYEYFGDYLFEEGFSLYHHILESRKFNFHPYGIAIELNKSSDTHTNLISIKDVILELGYIAFSSDIEFDNKYKYSNLFENNKILRDHLNRGFTRYSELSFIISTLKLKYNDTNKYLINNQILIDTKYKKRYKNTTIEVRDINIERLRELYLTFNSSPTEIQLETSKTPPQSDLDDILSNSSSTEIQPETPIELESFPLDEQECRTLIKKLEQDIEWTETEQDRIRLEIEDLKEIDETSIGYENASEEISLLTTKLNILSDKSIELETRRFDLSYWIEFKFN